MSSSWVESWTAQATSQVSEFKQFIQETPAPFQGPLAHGVSVEVAKIGIGCGMTFGFEEPRPLIMSSLF
jgi:hypothetical protein